MSARPEDMALLRRLAMYRESEGRQFEAIRGDATVHYADAARLRALASRLEGEGRDGERLAEAVLDLWDSRPAVIANDAEYFAHTARQDAKREKVLELARAIAPASSPQPTTTTEEYVS